MNKQYPMPLAGESAMQLHQEYVDNIVTTTWYDVRKQMFGDIWQITPLLDLLNTKGKIKQKLPNGRFFEIPITYAKADQNQKWFGRGTTFGVDEKQLWTRLQYQRKNLGDSIVRYWDDEQDQQGDAKILDYVKMLLNNHKMTMESTLATALWTNPDDNPLAINTLPDLISVTPTTGTVGGLTRSSSEYLQNNHTAFSGTLSTDLIPTMRNMFNTCSLKKGMGRRTPDIIVTTQALAEEYEDQCEAYGRITLTGNQGGDLGFGDLSFKGIPVTWDPECPDGYMYFLNSDSMEFVYSPNAWMEMTQWKERYNGLERYAQVLTVCNLCFNNFQKNGIISGLA
jgi:hypothetical protein